METPTNNFESDDRWRQSAACIGADPELFFPKNKLDTVYAKEFCAECPVREECLAYALNKPEKEGVWGGLDPRERRRLRRELGLMPAHSTKQVGRVVIDAASVEVWGVDDATFD